MGISRIGVVMWPVRPWAESREEWRRAEELGFDTAWVYDHVAWRGEHPWYDAYTTLAAAAELTSGIRLGTLVTSPNFRHPVPTAHAARTIDEISGGRLTLAVGAGGTSRNTDGGILGDGDWSRKERSDRLTEWVELLDRLLRGPMTTYTGEYYSAVEVLTDPGCVQRPRVPFGIAGNGPRGMRLAARQGDLWVTTDEPVDGSPAFETARRQLAALDEACAAEGRDPADIRRLLLIVSNSDSWWLESAAAFEDLTARYGELGFTDLAVHWPRPDTPWAADMKTFESIAPASR